MADQSRVALLAALIGTANGRHQEAPVMRLKLQLERADKIKLLAQTLLELLVEMDHQRTGQC